MRIPAASSNALHRTLVAGAALALAACASTTMRDSWFDPAVRTAPFSKVLVVTVGGEPTARRIFEDIVAAKLRSAGVEGMQGYRFLPDGRVSEDEMKGAVARSGADGLMLVHFRGVRTETEVRTTMMGGPMGPGWWGWYGGWAAQPEVFQTRIATIETTLFDVPTNKLVWTGVTESYDPASFRKEADGLAKVIVGAIASHDLTPSRPQA
jgi:hypothetical protein